MRWTSVLAVSTFLAFSSVQEIETYTVYVAYAFLFAAHIQPGNDFFDRTN